MKRMCRTNVIVATVLLAGSSSALVGCDQELAAQVASLSGVYVGDVAAVAATRFFQTVWGVEGIDAGDTHEDSEHEHGAEPLHEHEH